MHILVLLISVKAGSQYDAGTASIMSVVNNAGEKKFSIVKFCF